MATSAASSRHRTPRPASTSIWGRAARPKACWGRRGCAASAAVWRGIGGQRQGRRLFRDDDERGRAQRLGITDLNRKYDLLDMAHGDVMFAATGVTNGSMLKGVRRFSGGAFTHSVVMRSKTGTVRWVEATHDFTRKQNFSPLGR